MAEKERPILFSAPMVRAILAGKKTQTRRLLRHDGPPEHPPTEDFCAPGAPPWEETCDRGYWIGCNEVGTTIFARCPYGGRSSPGRMPMMYEATCNFCGGKTRLAFRERHLRTCEAFARDEAVIGFFHVHDPKVKEVSLDMFFSDDRPKARLLPGSPLRQWLNSTAKIDDWLGRKK